MWIEAVDVEAHVPSVVPRTVTVIGSPPRFWFERLVHAPGPSVSSTTSSQPPEATDGCSVSWVWVAHLVMMRTSVAAFSKSTSNSLNALPNGVHCTEMVPMFGGTRTPSYGYAIVIAGGL